MTELDPDDLRRLSSFLEQLTTLAHEHGVDLDTGTPLFVGENLCGHLTRLGGDPDWTYGVRCD